MAKPKCQQNDTLNLMLVKLLGNISKHIDINCNQTFHIETVVLLSKKNAKNFVEIGVDAEDYYRIKEK